MSALDRVDQLPVARLNCATDTHEGADSDGFSLLAIQGRGHFEGLEVRDEQARQIKACCWYSTSVIAHSRDAILKCIL